MFKEVSSEASTKQLRKTKLLESFRPAANKTKIMLTDLCPEQKAKIGELVRTLQARKSENVALEDKIKQMEKREKKYLDRLQQLESKLEDTTTKQLKMKEELTLIKIKQQQRQQYIQHLIQQKDELKSKARCAPMVDQFALTEAVLTQNQYVQASQKRKKCKQKQIQTEANREYEERRYPNNSRSFQKIMKGRSNSQSQNNSIERGGKKKVEYLIEKKGKSQIVANFQNQNEQQGQQEWDNNIKNNERQQNSQDDFNELAKKWLQLKQKNMSKIKQSYKKSKQKISQSNLKSSSRAIKEELPGQFKQKNITQEEDEEDNIQQDDDINDNQSFGPKRVKNKQISKSKQVDEDFDDIELNRILKSKNFSASRLLHKNRQQSQESERVDTKGEQRRGKRIGQIQNTPNMKMSSASNTRSNQNMDFYETDLLDIVSSINRR